MLGYFNNWAILKLSHESTSSEEIDKIYQVVLDAISDNMAALVQTGQYGAINTIDTATMGYYVIGFMWEPYNLQEETTCDGQISTAGKIFSKAQYINCMKDNTKWYQKQQYKKSNIIVPTRTIVHTWLDVTTATKG